MGCRQVPSERTCHTAIVHKNKMFVLGGMDRSNTIHGIKKELAILNFGARATYGADTEVVKERILTRPLEVGKSGSVG